VYFQLTVKTLPGLKVNALLGSPVVQHEIKRDVNEAWALAASGGAISPEVVESLREAAHARARSWSS
jgi:hypothetical protein